MTMTNTSPVEIQNLIEAHVNGFNTHDNPLFRSVSGTLRSSSTVLRRIAG